MSDVGDTGGVEVGGPDDRLLPWRKVCDITGLSRTTVWRLQKAQRFPQPVALSPGRVGWWESELTAWKRGRSKGGFRPPDSPRLPGMPRKTRPAAPAAAPTLVPVQERATQPVMPVSSEVARDARPAPRRRARSVSPGQIDFGF